MEEYIKLVEFLGVTLGPDYEVVLYEINEDQGKIIAIYNGVISGRNIGDPLTEFTKKSLEEKIYKNMDFRPNYRGIAKGNKFLRCSTFFIKDSEENLKGIMCINFDGKRFEKVAETILGLCHPDELVNQNYFQRIDKDHLAKQSENVTISIIDYAKHIIDDVVDKYPSPENLSKKEKIQIVKELNDKKIFAIRQSLQFVAERLKISEPTIYRYLSNLNEEE